MEDKIVYLKTIQLVPHPKNPRIDVGDVTELAESIKVNGIMQNLTVVPTENTGQYKVIIGHRRLAAAKLAGIEEVPCAIKNLTEKEQQAIMLAENMQRTDLTLYEQAQGIQMCLDLGMSESDVCDKTGFSKSTVHRRTKLLKYNKDKVNQAIDQGATLQDFIKLESIEDEEQRLKLSDFLGTEKFQKKLGEAIRNQETNKALDELEQRLIDAGYGKKTQKEINEINQCNKIVYMSYQKGIYDKDTAKKYLPNPELNMVFVRNNTYQAISLYKINTRNNSLNQQEQLNKLKKEIAAKRSDIIEQKLINLQLTRMEQFNACFLKKTTNWMSNKDCQKKLLTWYLFITNNADFELDLNERLVSVFCKKFGYINALDDALDMKRPYLNLAILTYLRLEVGDQDQNRESLGYGDTCNTYDSMYEKKYKLLYRFLEETIDYKMDENEKAIIFGTDPLFDEVTDKDVENLKGE